MSYVPVYRTPPRQHQMSGLWDDLTGGSPDDHMADVNAILQYMSDTPIKTAQAGALRDAFIKWRDGLSGECDRACWDHARNLRSDFQDANATTQAEKDAIAVVRKTGLTSEQTQGGGSRQKSDGKYSEIPETKPDLLPTWAKFAIGFAVVGVGVYALHEVRLFATLFKKSPKAAEH